MSDTAPRWRMIQPPLPAEQLDSVPPLSRLQVQLLANRGVTDLALIRRWWQPDSSCLPDWRALPDAIAAIARLRQACAAKERIGLVGDCDVDGLTATTIMASALSACGCTPANIFINPRSEDGRGLTDAIAAQLIAAGVTLCITVDNGSSSVSEVASLRAANIDTIITDHHHISEPAPQALALVNPQKSDENELQALSGAGVALLLARGLLHDLAWEDTHMQQSLALASMGTLADVVPLTLINRAIVALGLVNLRQFPSAGIAALLTVSNESVATITPRTVAFALAPRLNAAGRLDDPLIALQLLQTDDPDHAVSLAAKLEQLNRLRQTQTEEALAQAEALAAPQISASTPIIFVASHDWSPGIIGLIAGRLAERYDRLAVAIAIQEQGCRGSLRGPATFDIGATLAQLEPPLPEAGGHVQAGGFSCAEADLERIQKYLANAYMARPASAPSIQRVVDARIPLERITWEMIEQIYPLAPFGSGFAEPTFVTEDVHLVHCWRIGGDQHAKLVVERNGQRRAFFWRRGGRASANLTIGQTLTMLWNAPSQRPLIGDPEPLVVDVIPASS
jgi:single-stranded-DNA-specific exonuclease